MKININTNELKEILDATPADQNIMLTGKHGIGKSRILTDHFESKGIPVITLFLGQMSDPGDLIGLPNKDETTGKTDFMPPYWFPTDGQPIVLFLDELNRARPEILQSVMDLSLNRKLAGKSLPAGSRIISAVNAGDEYQLTDLDPALVSRFNIYNFAPSVEDWLLWATRAGLDDRVIAYITEHSEDLDGTIDEAMDNLDKTPDRRAWERVSNLIKGREISDTIKKAIAGMIGPKAANGFCMFAERSKRITAKDLLHRFYKVIKDVKKMSLPQLSALNTDFMRTLETLNLENEDRERIESNAAEYVDWLLTAPNREPGAHFVNLFQSMDYPMASNFLLQADSDLIGKMKRFIMNK